MTVTPCSISDQPLFQLLETGTKAFLTERTLELRLSFQDCRQACEIALDFQMWGAESIEDIWPQENCQTTSAKARKQGVMRRLRSSWEDYRNRDNQYPEKDCAPKISAASIPRAIDKNSLGLGRCPVASAHTLCCNLQTLDAVDNCGYGCSYCSIQSFFDGKQIGFDKDFVNKLKNLELDAQQIYHIGTGQSSDSLMWGNSHGVLDALIDFARTHPNVILELKTKSANVNHLLRVQAPKNILCTWSLNTPTLIQFEEHGTATLDKRLHAARRVADAGYLVGFHFHPIVHYDQWQRDYALVVRQLDALFKAEEVALVSMGTLTYIKSVMREIRKRAIPTQILKMPMVDTNGKQSYPVEIKHALFSQVYNRFPERWKNDVFFYLCMEDRRLWKPVFGYEYASNTGFEAAMKEAYMDKINQNRSRT
ncbi:MAG: DNA photolyase [Gammaproteobacteria bacterium]|nr:DNA photolyase [Gammaproteobacteria bacterium]